MLHFGRPFVVMAAAVSVLLLVVLDRVLLAGGFRSVAFCHVSLVGSPLEVIASFRNRPIVIRFQLPVACVSSLELAVC